jgi:prepilin-type N-terminal cleavage/methylation domain-containing protein
VRRRDSGYTLVEVVWVLAIFGIFLFMLTVMTEELRRQEIRYPIDFLKHPQIISVVSRMRRDVIDAFGAEAYPRTFNEYAQTDKTLIIYTIFETGSQTVVWDFRTKGEARRMSFSAGMMVSEWTARGVPNFTVSTFTIPGRPYAVRLQAKDKKGRLAIDQIFQPRAHE